MLSNKERVRNPWTDTLARLEDERVMLQRIAAGVPLADVLLYVLHAVEAQSSVPLRTAIAFVDEGKKCLVHGAAPSFSESYRRAINGVPIGPNVGSWGAAAYFGTAVYVNDVMTDPNWVDWREFAVEQGIRACWSTPIKGTDGQVLGVFSNYYATTRLPSPQDIDAIALVTRTAALAIERWQYDRELEKRVELAIAERDRIWRLSPELLAVVNAEGRYVSVNPAVKEILGWTPEEFLSMSLADQVHPEDYAISVQAFVPTGQGGVRHLENRMRHRNGTYSWITWSISRSEGDVYLAGRDDTDLRAQAEALRQAEEALRQSQKMEAVGQLTGGIAHDFNNMLQSISGALYLIRRKLAAGDAASAERFIDTAMESTERAARLTQRLLAFARRQPIAPVPLCPVRVLQSMEDLFRRYTGEHVKLVVHSEQVSWPVSCDANQLENALLNMVINARDAMPDGGQLDLRATNTQLDAAALRQYPHVKPGDFVEITVSDTGCGMSEEVMSRAFEPFFTTKAIGEGSGLGLSMIYGFAQQAGGLVCLESKEGEGTRVRLFLPRYVGSVPPMETDARLLPSITEESLPNFVVALVEDDAAVRQMVSETLKQLRLEVLTASDGLSGRELVGEARRIDLLLTDVGLPGLNGRELADAARRTHPNLKVLFMTGYAQNAIAGEGFLSEGMELIVKPFRLEVLIERVRRILAI
ncbi:ATP-binding protein [Bordetella sp. 02P26C-1]|uniref:ATP-binding protein n=1 Tax=Bordetella sp. 02P26C-1 TaxID=2683195 RepID=UPI0013538ECC|nr:ATP-binding protein [Bordetella sp. 02P26C-1]MVW79838.1 response regulator [Bordetella sp. 02P26C-1]